MSTTDEMLPPHQPRSVLPDSLFSSYYHRLRSETGFLPFQDIDSWETLKLPERVDTIKTVSSILADLIKDRMQEPLDAPIKIAEFDFNADEMPNTAALASRIVPKASQELGIHHLQVSGHAKPTDEAGIEIKEIVLPGGWYVRTHIGQAVCSLVLSPDPLSSHELVDSIK